MATYVNTFATIGYFLEPTWTVKAQGPFQCGGEHVLSTKSNIENIHDCKKECDSEESASTCKYLEYTWSEKVCKLKTNCDILEEATSSNNFILKLGKSFIYDASPS